MKANIEAEKTDHDDRYEFQVTVREGRGETHHRVTLQKADYERLTGGKASPEAPVNEINWANALREMVTKPVRLSGHARVQLTRRGVSEDEVIEVIRTSSWQPAELGRLERRKNFLYGREWNGKFYETKQVRPIFVEEAEEIVVVTVYSYYF